MLVERDDNPLSESWECRPGLHKSRSASLPIELPLLPDLHQLSLQQVAVCANPILVKTMTQSQFSFKTEPQIIHLTEKGWRCWTIRFIREYNDRERDWDDFKMYLLTKNSWCWSWSNPYTIQVDNCRYITWCPCHRSLQSSQGIQNLVSITYYSMCSKGNATEIS